MMEKARAKAGRAARRNWVLAGSIAAAAALAGGVWFQRGQRPSASPPPPPVLGSRFLNSAGVEYAGSQACAECHADQHESYGRTNHRLALSDVDAGSEPAKGEFYHGLSGRSYRVDTEGSVLQHRELIRAASGAEPIVLSDFSLKYRVGSGALARTYLAEVDGFLVESPITWYAARNRWHLSPGYDAPQHPGFSRPVSENCLFCHAGRVEPVAGAYHKFRIHEKGIGCERCHGPGALHVRRRRSGAEIAADEDFSIVNPSRLGRDRLEDVCAQCHLGGEVSVAVRGRRAQDFRPGLRLSDFRISYRLQDQSREMTVVGHVEQMRLSRCYLHSDTLTCVTCHDPHREIAPSERVVSYRAKCLDCHAEQGCGLPEGERLARNAADDCAACHMPPVETDVPHVASTHHRIGLFGESDREPERLPGASAVSPSGPALVPLGDVSHLPAIERDRCLGLAYVELAKQASDRTATSSYISRARRLLLRVDEAGIRDAELSAGLARVLWRHDPERALRLAEEVIESEEASAEARSTALFVAADLEMKRDRTERAVELLNELIRIRRHAVHWEMLAQCRRQLGDMSRAAESLRRAAEAAPDRPDLQDRLAALYEQLGDVEEAERHRRRAERLRSAGL